MSWIKRTLNKAKILAQDKNKQRQFAWLNVVLVLLFVGLDLYVLDKYELTNVGYAILLSYVGIGLLVPKLYYFPLLLWLLLGYLLSEITSTLVLGVVYFVIFFPITFLLRIFRKKTNSSGWKDYNNPDLDYKKLY